MAIDMNLFMFSGFYDQMPPSRLVQSHAALRLREMSSTPADFQGIVAVMVTPW